MYGQQEVAISREALHRFNVYGFSQVFDLLGSHTVGGKLPIGGNDLHPSGPSGHVHRHEMEELAGKFVPSTYFCAGTAGNHVADTVPGRIQNVLMPMAREYGIYVVFG
ncbi:hypothetical protein ES703_124094 [subsurface metagenome]